MSSDKIAVVVALIAALGYGCLRVLRNIWFISG